MSYLGNNVWFTSDSHFSHKNILKYCKRVIFCDDTEKDIILNGSDQDKKDLMISDETIQRMNDGLIDNWNSVVKQNDIVYHLGDFMLGPSSPENFDKIFNRLNGKIIFIEGNHDKIALQNKSKFHEYHKYLETTICGQKMVLFHYSMRTWLNQGRLSQMLYAHSHNNLPDDSNSLSFDVGVDCHQYFPISFDQVQSIMKKKVYKSVDHHN